MYVTWRGRESLECSSAPDFQPVRSSRQHVHSNAVVGMPWLADQVRKIISPPISSMKVMEEKRGKTWAAAKGPFSASAARESKVQGTKVPCPRQSQKMWPLATKQPASLPRAEGGCKQGLARALNRESDFPIHTCSPAPAPTHTPIRTVSVETTRHNRETTETILLLAIFLYALIFQMRIVCRDIAGDHIEISPKCRASKSSYLRRPTPWATSR